MRGVRFQLWGITPPGNRQLHFQNAPATNQARTIFLERVFKTRRVLRPKDLPTGLSAVLSAIALSDGGSWSEGGRVFAPKALWLRCSSVDDPPGIWASQALPFSFRKHCSALPRMAVSFVAPRHRAFGAKTEPLLFSKHALIKFDPTA